MFLGPGRAPGSLWRCRLCPNNLVLVTFSGNRGSSGVLRAGGAEKTKAVGVPPDKGTFFAIGGGTGCTVPYSLFSGIGACAFDGETKILVTPFPFCQIGFVVASPDTVGLAIRGSGLGVGVKSRLPVARLGVANCEVPGCCEKTFSRECGVSCFVYAMERGTERTTTGVARGGAVNG